jgi:hypothetical protein
MRSLKGISLAALHERERRWIDPQHEAAGVARSELALGTTLPGSRLVTSS